MATPIPSNDARLTVWDVAAATGGRVVRVRGEGAIARGVYADSRAIRPSTAFLALRGGTHDAHAFVPDAMAAGAALVIVEAGRAPAADEGASDVVEVYDGLVAWGAIARAHLREWRRARLARGVPGRTVAITGSAGKTTTKELCAALLRTFGKTLATAGNLNNRIGLPAMALCARPDDDFVVLEMGMSLPGEIERIAAIAKADVAVITNVGVAHAEGVGGSRAGVAREKGAVYEALARTGCAIVNADDGAARGQLARTRATRALLFGRAADADYRLVARTPKGALGSHLVVARPKLGGGEETLELVFPLVGEVAAIDLLGALAAAEAAAGASVPEGALHAALAAITPTPGRAEIREIAGQITLIDDSYNANPGSVRAALHALGELGHGRRLVAVLGEMRELGPLAREEHASIGEALIRENVAVAIGCGGLIDLALDAAARGRVRVHRAATTDAAAAIAVREVRPGDVVLVKASRSVGAERVIAALMAKGAA